MRGEHATCFIGVDTSHTQLMITGGWNSAILDDMWLLDITSMTWRKVSYNNYYLSKYIIAIITNRYYSIYNLL